VGWSGIALALPAVALTSWEGKAAGFGLSDIAYGVGAGCGFGLLFVALDQAGADSGAWPLLPGQIVALVIVTAVAVPQIDRIRRGRVRPQLSAALGCRVRRVGRVGKPTFSVRKRRRPIDCRRSAGLSLSRIHCGVGCRGPA
jgi:hypothetical protein